VHWRWCLANHSCNPSVRWAWGAGTQTEGGEKEDNSNGEIVFRVRDEPVWRRPRSGPAVDGRNDHCEDLDGEEEGTSWGGIRPGEEILSHYCDVDLPVVERRAWARGALGGSCRCVRCLWESSEGGR